MNWQLFEREDVAFDCQHCGTHVERKQVIAVDHCPACLHSVHLDNQPGDRAVDCGGLMKPVSVYLAPKRTERLVQKCVACGTEKENKIVSGDNRDLVIELTAFPSKRH